MTTDEHDTATAEFWSHPEEFFRKARSQCPVAELPGDGGYIITRYDDVVAASRRVKEFSSRRPVFGANDPELAAIAAEGYPEVRTITTNDPPVHTRYRRLVNKAFFPEQVKALEPKIQALVDTLLDEAAERGEMNFVGDFAEVMPAMVMSDALGIPHDMRDTFRGWAQDMVDTVAGDMALPPERRVACKKSFVQFQHYFAALIEERRAHPGDDMVSHLVHARLAGERPLDVPELLDVCRILLVAGNDTTTNLLSGALLALIDHPEQLAEVAADTSLVPRMVEESLRYISPARWTMRIVAEDGVEMAGCPLAKGEKARLGLGSANWDEQRFPDPERFDIHRDTSGHMAFGHGIHFCVGKDLARAETRIAFQTLFERFTDFELTVPRAELKPVASPGVNRLNKLPIRFRAR